MNGSMPAKYRTALTRLRLRSLRLGIIRGRWTRDEDEARCRRCTMTECVDDEEHLIMDCGSMDQLKQRFLEVFTKSSMTEVIQEADPADLAKFLLQADKIITAADEEWDKRQHVAAANPSPA